MDQTCSAVMEFFAMSVVLHLLWFQGGVTCQRTLTRMPGPNVVHLNSQWFKCFG